MLDPDILKEVLLSEESGATALRPLYMVGYLPQKAILASVSKHVLICRAVWNAGGVG